MIYTGRDMTTVHAGMQLDDEDWLRVMDHLSDTLEAFAVPDEEKSEVIGFVERLKPEVVEVP